MKHSLNWHHSTVPVKTPWTWRTNGRLETALPFSPNWPKSCCASNSFFYHITDGSHPETAVVCRASFLLKDLYCVPTLSWCLPCPSFTASLKESWSAMNNVHFNASQDTLPRFPSAVMRMLFSATVCPYHLPEHREWRLTGYWSKEDFCRTRSAQKIWLVRVCSVVCDSGCGATPGASRETTRQQSTVG